MVSGSDGSEVKRLQVVLAMSLVTLLGAGACASRPPTKGEARPRAGATLLPGSKDTPPGLPSSDWDHPFAGQGVQVQSVQDAQASLPFTMYVPKSLENPSIYISPPDSPQDLMAVWLVYDDPKYGRVWVGESLPDIPDEAARKASYDAIVASNGQADVYSVAEIVTIRDGIMALTGTSVSSPVATIEWVEDGVQFAVMGPTLSTEQVLALANAL